MPSSIFTVSPCQRNNQGEALSLVVCEEWADDSTIVIIPVTHIDSLVSALYSLRQGQLTGSEEVEVKAKPKSNVVSLKPGEEPF